jgi:hypothetical protein
MAVDRVHREPLSAEFSANREKYREISRLSSKNAAEKLSILLIYEDL